VGEVELEERVLVLRRIHVTYTLRAADADRETVERVHAVHHNSCPVYRSIASAIAITTEFHLVSDETGSSASGPSSV
jgi:uncharacterized OsmC-like protein